MQRIFLLTGCLLALAGATAETVRVASPDGLNEIRVDCTDGLRYSVWREGRQRLAPAPVSLCVRGKRFSPRVVSSEPFTLSGEEKTRLYKKSSVSLAANGCRLKMDGGFGLELVARNDGVAYRFTTSFPEQEVIVEAEEAPVRFPAEDVSIWAGYPNAGQENGKQGWISNWEPVYTNLNSRAAGLKTDIFAALPLVAEYGDGVCLCITESDQRDYPGWLLRGKGVASELAGEFAPEPIEEMCTGTYHHGNMTRHDYLARTKGVRTYPWRLFILAASCVQLCEADAPYALAEPCRLADTSWIRPGLVQWDWWHNRNITQVDFRTGINTATYLHYVDFAAEHGVPYVLIDGGWSKDYRMLNHIPELDLKVVAARAAAKGVALIIWTPWAALIGCQEETFTAYEELGVKGVKIDGICRNDRFFTSFAEETARIAAEHHIVVDYHGISKPSGLSRTYPNILTYEGVHGLENTKWEGTWMPKCDFPQNDLTDFFCRMTAGPMDYTPGAMRNFAKGEYRYSNSEPGSDGTRVRQLAMYVMYESPLQMLSDSPSLYRANPECFAFMRTAPTVWDETRGLAGRIGAFAAVARRQGAVWHVGAMTDWTARELDIQTDFLGSGVWTAEIFEDGVNADRNATDWRRRTAEVRAGDRLHVKMAPGGGWAARFVRRRP